MIKPLRFVFASLFVLGTMAVTVGEEPVIPTPAEMWDEDRTRQFDAIDLNLEDFVWVARPVVVFANSAADPAFQRQIELLTERFEQLSERDVVLIVDTDPAGESPLRQKLRPRGFMLVLIGKDGGVKLRKPFPWDVRELTRVIDKSPIRQQEVRDRRNLNQ